MKIQIDVEFKLLPQGYTDSKAQRQDSNPVSLTRAPDLQPYYIYHLSAKAIMFQGFKLKQNLI